MFAPFPFLCFTFYSQAGATCLEGCGGGNTYLGENALGSYHTANYNTAIGFATLEFLDDAYYNTAIGAGALTENIANNDTATGYNALNQNLTGTDNTANGYQVT